MKPATGKTKRLLSTERPSLDHADLDTYPVAEPCPGRSGAGCDGREAGQWRDRTAVEQAVLRIRNEAG